MNLKQLKNNTLFVNITSIGVVQLANYAIPLLIIPYVVRALLPDAYGMACYAQTVVAYLTLLVNFGFEYSATQEVAIHRTDKQALRNIFWSVIKAKALLLLLTFLILGILYFIMPRVKQDPAAFLCASLINVGFMMFPTWFFQGMEKMAKMSIFTFFVKAIGAIFTVLLVSCPDDYRLYLLSLSVAQIAVGVFTFFYIIRKYDLTYAPVESLKRVANDSPSLLAGVIFRSVVNAMQTDVVKKGLPIFLNTFFVSSNLYAGITIMGWYLTDTDIGIYSGAQRIIMAILMIASQPITISLFPRISRKFEESMQAGLQYLKKSLLYVSLFSLLVSVVTYVASPLAVSILLGEKFIPSIGILEQMSVLPFLVTMDSTITVQGLYGMQLQKYAPMVGATTCVTNIVLNLIFIPKYGLNGAVYVWIICQVVDIVLALALIRKKSRENK